MFLVTSSIVLSLDRYLVKSGLVNFSQREHRPKRTYAESNENVQTFGAYNQLEQLRLQSDEIQVRSSTVKTGY